METYASHLHKAPGKKFWHYFFEFFMLFLAVFCGFLAENLRELRVEKTRATEYMNEIVDNLRYDIIRCNKNLYTNIKVCSGLDSLRTELKNAIAGNTNSNALYYLSFQYAGQFGWAVSNNSAITELKSSGNLRLIENKVLVNELSDYYERKVFATTNAVPSKDQILKLQTKSNDLFNLQLMDDYISSFDQISDTTYNNIYNYKNLLNHQPALPLLNTNKAELSDYYTQISQFEIAIKKYIFWLKLDKQAADQLIKDIVKEYPSEK